MAVLVALLAAGCSDTGHGPPRLIRVPAGASFAQVADTLGAHGLVHFKPLFRLYARVRGDDQRVKAGTYELHGGVGWAAILDALRNGRVATERLVIPEGWDSDRAAPRIAHVTGLPEDSVLAVLRDTASAVRYGVPGPDLEGYLFPATYEFPIGVGLDSVLAEMTAGFREAWTPARQAEADSLHLSPRQVVTLASIIQDEAKLADELPRIASVYENRLRIGMALQADPTVQYALGGHRSHLSYAAIDSVADNAYNTYTHAGLPPGPIGSPSAAALDAVLHPEHTDYLFFVATPDGSHVFSRTLAEHNRAKQRIHEEMDTRSRDTATGSV
jgi:peptidoglycan lytic transglycosylase G